jgi:hypothetical protein
MDLPVALLDHQQNLQLKGIFVPGMEDYRDSQGVRMYREFRLQFSNPHEPLDPVSMKLTIRPADATPYSYVDDQLLYEGQELAFGNVRVYRVPIPLEEDPWHWKGYTFPFRGSRNPYRELRINPRISGYCPGKCVFCHRTHSHRIRSRQKLAFNPDQLMEEIKAREGEDVFSHVTRVMIISELFGNEHKFLDAVQQTSAALSKEEVTSSQDFNCCATDVRSLDGLKRLHDLVRPNRFSFSLEFFQDRERWMGKYKGLPMDQVYTILEHARKAGFAEIQLNYLAGIDPLDVCKEGFFSLSRAGLVDSVGLSTFTIFAEDEAPLRMEAARLPEYYQALVAILNDCHIKAYHPDSYDLGCPYTELMEKTQ